MWRAVPWSEVRITQSVTYNGQHDALQLGLSAGEDRALAHCFTDRKTGPWPLI